jgi:cysteinyl-tRNA synthetase
MLCEEMEKLLYRLSMDYKDYYFKTHKKSCEGIAYRKYELRKNGFEFVQQVNLEQINSALDFLNPATARKDRLKENEIIRMISQRDKARKQGKYKEADMIRDELKREGVVLIDEKHANGHLCKTTWKYLDE